MSESEDARWAERAAAIVEVAREAAVAEPAPRGAPFFGVDHRSGTPFGTIEDLATRGIFRKYEHVLDLGAGLGATSRYLITRLGCSATATASSPAEARAGQLLTTRAGLDWHVAHAVADPARLPFSEAAFTHVWVVEALPVLGTTADVLAEAFRVLRPGGHLGVQEIVLRGQDAALAERGYVGDDVRRAQMEVAGFVEVVQRDVPAAHATESDAVWNRLVRRLGPADTFVTERVRIGDALAGRRAGLVQLTARRP
jgi:SAM-dependent methyltransferase